MQQKEFRSPSNETILIVARAEAGMLPWVQSRRQNHVKSFLIQRLGAGAAAPGTEADSFSPEPERELE